MHQLKEPKRCERCNKIIDKKSITGLCIKCYHYNENKKRRYKLFELHKCVTCEKNCEKVKQIISKGNKIIEVKEYYLYRCLKCQKLAVERYYERKLKNMSLKS